MRYTTGERLLVKGLGIGTVVASSNGFSVGIRLDTGQTVVARVENVERVPSRAA